MKLIVSKRFKEKGIAKEQIIDDAAWARMVVLGIDKRYDVTELPERKLKDVPILPPEIKRKKKDEQNN